MKIETGTIARTAVLVIALINQLCAIMGWTPLDLDEDMIYQVCTIVATIGASLWSWWKNNSFTKAALEADKVLKSIKTGVTEE